MNRSSDGVKQKEWTLSSQRTPAKKPRCSLPPQPHPLESPINFIDGKSALFRYLISLNEGQVISPIGVRSSTVFSIVRTVLCYFRMHSVDPHECKNFCRSCLGLIFSACRSSFRGSGSHHHSIESTSGTRKVAICYNDWILKSLFSRVHNNTVGTEVVLQWRYFLWRYIHW